MPPYRDFPGVISWITIVGRRVSAVSAGSGNPCLRGGKAPCGWGVAAMCAIVVGACRLACQSVASLCLAVLVGWVLIGGKLVVGLWAVVPQICIWIVWEVRRVLGAPVPFGLDGLLFGNAATCQPPC